MGTAIIQTNMLSSGISKEKQSKAKPKRLSKAGLWMLRHPNGIFKVLDWKAVDK